MGLSWTTTARIAVSGFEGWTPVERVEVPHASGRALVRVERFPVAADADLDALATMHGEVVMREGWEDSGLSVEPVLGSAAGLVRTLRWTDGEGTGQQMVLSYALDQSRLIVITTVVPVADHALAAEASTVASSVRMREAVRVPGTVLPLRPGQVDLHAVADAWRGGVGLDGAAEHVLTTDESFGAARHFGVAMLPGADTGYWDELDVDQRELVAGVAWRSLEARGAGSGTELAEALELASSHDLIVLVSTRKEDDSSDSQWFAARPDRMVRIRPSGPGRMVLSVHPTFDLADLVLSDPHQPGTVVTASAVYRCDGHVIGDETTWSVEDTADHVRAALAGLVSGSPQGSEM